jgi:hypothetical protein
MPYIYATSSSTPDFTAVDFEFASDGALAGTCLVQRTYRVFEY